jgi:hypothetical protein
LIIGPQVHGPFSKNMSDTPSQRHLPFKVITQDFRRGARAVMLKEEWIWTHSKKDILWGSP